MAQAMGSSYRKGLTLSLGSVIQTQVDLYSVVPSSKGESLHRLCPTHKLQLNQVHKCPEGHEVLSSEWVMGRDTATGMQIAPTYARPQVEASDMLELRPVPINDIEGNTFDGPGIYYAKPTPATIQAWLAIQAILKAGKVALIAKGAFRKGQDKMWRIQNFRDYLVLREIVFPEDIRDTPEPEDTTLEKGTLTLVQQFLEGLMTTWDDIDTTNRSREQLREWLENGESIETKPREDNTGAAASLIEQLKQATQK